ncbi:hypothetical protein Zmor_008197 [Zophobas morio]|uniref:Uncharacterized protein n=1 Tax=Zophobas morio TaxID=2755281 RepID=A0AA38IVX9_9CUCU|nr:hypothetical protein Zmor_008197 [Zophobas morio]
MAIQTKSLPCMVCTMHLKYDISEYFFPFHFFCPHRSHRFSLKPCYKFWKPYLLIYAFFTLYLWYAIYSYFSYIPLTCQNLSSSCIMFVADLLFVLGTSLLGILLLLSNPKTNFLEMDSWLFVFEHLQDYDLQDMIDDQAAAKFKFLRILSSCMVVTSAITIIPLLLYAYDSLPGNFIRKTAICICYNLQSLGFTMLVQRITLIGTILRQLEKNVSPKFTKKLSVKKYQNLVGVLHTTISMLMRVTAMTLFLWALNATISLIFNIFISIKYQDFDVPNLVLLNLRTVVTFLSIFAVLDMSEVDINQKVSGIN